MKERSIDFGDHSATVTQFSVLGDDERTVDAVIVRLKLEGPQGFIRPRARSYALTAEEAVALGSALLAHGLDCQDANEQLDHDAMTATDHRTDLPAAMRVVQQTTDETNKPPPISPTDKHATDQFKAHVANEHIKRLRIVETPPPAPPLEGGVADETPGEIQRHCPTCGLRLTATANCPYCHPPIA